MDAYCKATELSDHTDEDLREFFQRLDREEEEILPIWNEYLVWLSSSTILKVHWTVILWSEDMWEVILTDTFTIFENAWWNLALFPQTVRS